MRAGTSLYVLVHQFGFVSVFPDFDQNDGRMESEKDAQRESDALNEGPGVKPEETQLQKNERKNRVKKLPRFGFPNQKAN